MSEPAPATEDPDRIRAKSAAQTELVSDFTNGGALGSYRLLQKIAEGGMGEVWLAEQKQPVRRRVALKLIKAGMDSREVVLRFSSERQTLALMDHPTIAKVYDAGTSPEGRPYFVMEYVPGVSIAEYCLQHRTSIRDRVELFIHVCEGVQHAHQKAIIHRDLKPSNILVSEIDGHPAPKIIDFGVAKALSQSLIEQTMYTRVGSIVGTLQYMSPEQANSGGEDIDTRSDIYSLGVILYELLAGVTPHDLSSSGYYEFVQKLRETETPKPSTRLRNLAQTNKADNVAKLNAAANELRGDLDCIALKCLEKDRNRRYASPSELAADLRRYLNHLPVLATPPSLSYRFQKFAQRNRTLLALASAFVVLLIAATGVSVYQAIRAHEAQLAAISQRDRADAEAATAKAVNEFLQNDLLSQAGADQQTGGDHPPDPDIKVRTLVDRAAQSVSKKLAGKPALQADLRNTLAATYISLGLLPQAKQQALEAYQLSLHSRGPLAQTTIDALMTLGSVEFNSDDYVPALQHQEAAWRASLNAFGPNASSTLSARQSMAVDYMVLGESAKAEPILKEVLDRQVKLFTYDNADTLNTSDSLAYLYFTDGHYPEAQQLFERGLQSYRKVFGPDHPNTQREIYGLARLLFNVGQYPRAEELTASVYDSNTKLLGPTHFKTLATALSLARIYEAEGKLQEAESLVMNVLRARQASSPTDTVDTLNTKAALADIYEDRKDYAKAGVLLADIERSSDRLYGKSNPESFINLQRFAANLLRKGQCETAGANLREVNSRWDAHPASGNWRRFEAMSLLGEAYTCEGKFAQAEPLLLSGYQGLQQSAARIPARQQFQTKAAAGRVARLYLAWKKPVAAAQWQAISSAAQ